MPMEYIKIIYTVGIIADGKILHIIAEGDT